MLSASESIVTLIFFGSRPGLYFDLVGLIFQVPDCCSAAAAETFRASATSSSVVAKAANILIRIIRPPSRGITPIALMRVPCQKVQRIQRILADFHRGSRARKRSSSIDPRGSPITEIVQANGQRHRRPDDAGLGKIPRSIHPYC